MLLAGDEFRRTQGGNNNAYCQDNETSWLDWTLLEKHREWFRFFKLMIKFRQSHRALGEGSTPGERKTATAVVKLLRSAPEHPDWS